jgi:hypothetical protein
MSVAGPALVSPHAAQLQAAHACQGKSNDCGPFSAAIVLNALLKAGVDPEQVARELERPRWWGPLPRVRRVPGYATFPWGVADALREHGLQASWRPWASTARLQRGLASGELLLPIYGGWKKGTPWAHFAVLAAHDPERGWGFVDPQHEHGGLVWHRDERFRRKWLTWGNLLVTARPPTDANRSV